MYTYTKNDYAILRKIYAKKAQSEMMSATIKTLEQETNLSAIKIRKTLKLFLEDGFVRLGIPNKKANTFYITPEGIKRLKDITEVRVND